MKCSRCGTADSKHTKDCYEAMILGWALGIEERPAQAASVQVDGNAELARRRLDENADLRAQVDSLTQHLAVLDSEIAPEGDPIARHIAELNTMREEIARLTAQLERAKETSGQWYDDWRKLYTAVQNGTAAPVPSIWEPPAPERDDEAEGTTFVVIDQPAPEPSPEELLRENVRDLLGEQAAADMELSPEELSKAEYATEASEREASTGPADEQVSTGWLRQQLGPKKTPSDAVEVWLNEEAIASNSEDARIVVATSPVVYAAWAADRPDMPDTVAPITVAKALKGRGYKRRAPVINGRQYPAYYGVRLRTPEPEPDGSLRETRPEEEVAIVERYVTARTRPSEAPDAIVTVADMYASYQRWCERTGQHDVGRDAFSSAMFQLGAYEKGVRKHGTAKALGYLGAELTPEPLAGTKPNEVPDNQTIRKAIAAARAAARKAHEEREAAEAAAAEPPPVVYRVKEDEPEKKADNNGWGKTFDTAKTEVPELTVADVMAEHAEIEPRGGYSGPRPSAGDKLDGETRDLINAILNLDEGWEYLPPEGRQSHSFVRAPDGSRFRQASSFGSKAGRIGNNRELRRYLNKKGMLPTAAAPASQLTSAKAASKPVPKPTPKPSTVKVIQSRESRLSSEEQIAVPAEPDAKPLTEEEMDKDLFDLWVDVRAGYDGPFTYHPDVESLYGLDRDGITNAVRHPERCEVRPESKSKGYPVIKFARGDVNVIMGYRDRKSPAVIRAEWGWLLGHSQYEVDRHGGGGSKAATGLPNTFAQLAGRLKIAGAEVTPSEDGKTAVVTYQGQELGRVTKEKCPRSTVHSDWNRITRKIQAIDRRELATV
jgi:hypothetical protein